MANYQRLISYIYAYEGGIRGKNIGFAKLETRAGQCRITVSVRKIFIGGNPIGVYLLAGQEEIRIGTLFARNGAGEFRAVVNARNIEGSGRTLEECCGLSVHDTESAWRAYTTIWEDAVAHAAEVDLEKVTAKEVRAAQARRENQAELQREAQKEEETESGPQRGAQEEEETESGPQREAQKEEETKSGSQREAEEEVGSRQEAEKVESSSRQEEEETESGPQREAQEEEETESGSQQEAEEEEAGSQQEALPISREIERELEREELDRLGILHIRKYEAAAEETGKAAQGEEAPGGREEASRGRDPKPPSGGSRLREELRNRETLPPPEIPVPFREAEDPAGERELWDSLRSRYPKILAFDYADGCEILAIKPQDIGLLPRENWGYGSNSFLLHGYYHYRYLILARLNQPGRSGRYLLGVPGHYQSNEKYMAAMFGFPDFVLSKRQPPGDSRFGYWYADIRFGA